MFTMILSCYNVPQCVKTITLNHFYCCQWAIHRYGWQKSLVPSNAVMGKANQQTEGQRRRRASLHLQLVGSLYQGKAVSDKEWNQQKLWVSTTLQGKHSFHFLSPFLSLSSVSLGGGGGAGEASFLPLLHLHLSPTWSWYKYCTIPLKETHKKDSHRHNQAGGLMPKWVYTGCMEKGPTAPRTRKAGSEYTTNHGIGWCLQQYCK